jgi:hypothetical protein
MRVRKSVRLPALLILLAAALLLSDPSARLSAQVFSVDPSSPLAVLPGGSPGNLYRPGGAVYSPAGSIGLLAGDNIDAFSFGFDEVSGIFPMGFSTHFFATGSAAAGNAVCSEAGICAPGAPCAPETMADIFSSFGGGVASLLFDGDGVPGIGTPLGLKECPPGGPGVQDNVDGFDELMAPLSGTTPQWRAYFSLAPGSPTLGGANPMLPGGARPADILVYDPGHNSLSIFFRAGDMGLSAAGDDIDGISLNLLTSDFFFSLAPGSTSLTSVAICGPVVPCTAGDFIRSMGPACGASPCNFFGAGGYLSFGLAGGDNVDAVDQLSRVPAFIDNPPDDTSPGKTFSVDRKSPVLAAIRTPAPIRPGSGADLLVTNRANPTGAPRVLVRAESLGLMPADDIDGLSFGREPMYAGGPYTVEFSVDRAAGGAAGSAVSIEASAPTGAEPAADVFDAFMPAGATPVFVGGNSQVWDGNGSSAPLLHLRDVPLDLVSSDHVDALEGPFQLVDPNNDGVRDLPIFFSLTTGSPTLAVLGAGPGDILICPAPACALPGIFLTAPALGLAAGDELEDFALNTATGVVDFTVPPLEAAALGTDPGAIIRRAGAAPCGAVPCTIFFAPASGLVPGVGGDNMTAFDSVEPLEACVRIIAGADPLVGVFYGACPPPGAAGPYDVIEGEIGELVQSAAGVNVSRVFCRASGLMADNLTLAGGLDRYTRARFILARNTAVQPHYGFSSAGLARNPSFGGCP